MVHSKVNNVLLWFSFGYLIKSGDLFYSNIFILYIISIKNK